MRIAKNNNKQYSGKLSKKYKKKQILLVLMIIVCFFSLIKVVARYAKNTISDFYFRSKEFYFYSDKLKANGAEYKIDNWSGVDDYTVTIDMNSKKNNLVVTSYDIGYKISYRCSENVICQLSKENSIIYASQNTDSFNLTLTPNTQLEVGDSVWVEIYVESTTNYKKTLSGKFILTVGKEELTYEVVDAVNNTYLELKLTNTLTYYQINEAFDSYRVGDKIDLDTYLELSEDNKNKCYSAWVTVEFEPNQVLLDMTDTNYLNATSIETVQLNGYNYISKISFKIEALSSSNIRFYKRDVTKDYSYQGENQNLIFTIKTK